MENKEENIFQQEAKPKVSFVSHLFSIPSSFLSFSVSRENQIQIFRFLIAGFAAVGTDFLTYFLFLEFFTEAIAKGASFLLGTFVAFVINKFWTFEKKLYSHTEVIKFSILYALTFAVNVVVNQGVLLILPGYHLFAFLVATACSTILNFIGQKWWVFV